MVKKTISIPALITALKKAYPEAKCTLDFETPFQLLVATILSAQCTDERVNQVTPALFKRFPTPQSLLQTGSFKEVETLIYSTGFFRNKAKSIVGAARVLCDKYAGQMPQTQAELVQLPGVGRKTANVVLGTLFGIQGIIVDTHVLRLCRRLNLTTARDPVKTELVLMELIPQEDWLTFCHALVQHGRTLCFAKRPLCSECFLAAECPGRISHQDEDIMIADTMAEATEVDDKVAGDILAEASEPEDPFGEQLTLEG